MLGSGARKAVEAMISVPVLVFGLRIVRDMRQAPTAENISYFVVWVVLSSIFLMWSARHKWDGTGGGRRRGRAG
ncbi:MAG: hypothetical protein QF415_13410 [Candidatus Undinarchaeales archaeon]|nr:hypothetical protein [Candidatus Undinarchaeales archaeon]MDP7494475.1 hypothetical protein [Candidatus Undinarchaeales archaeon]